MSKVRPIGTIAKLLFKAAYPFGKKKVDDLFKDGTFGDKVAIGGLSAVDETVDVLSDNEADNKQQLNEIWIGYLREVVLPAIGDEVRPILAGIKSEALEALLVSVAQQLVNSTYLLIDDIKENPAQLEAYAKEYFKGDAFRSLVTAWLGELVESNVTDEGLKGFFYLAIEGLFDMLQGKPVLENIVIDEQSLKAFVGK